MPTYLVSNKARQIEAINAPLIVSLWHNKAGALQSKISAAPQAVTALADQFTLCPANSAPPEDERILAVFSHMQRRGKVTLLLCQTLKGHLRALGEKWAGLAPETKITSLLDLLDHQISAKYISTNNGFERALGRAQKVIDLALGTPYPAERATAFDLATKLLLRLTSFSPTIT